MDHDLESSSVSSSASTVLVFPSTNHTNHQHYHDQEVTVHERMSYPSSPTHSTGLPSPPGSPALTDPSSESSLPSVSSSFFFSSAAASPPHPPYVQPHAQGSHDLPENGNPDPHASDRVHEGHAGEHLIIPSLSLPTALRQPTSYGQALGDVRLIVVKLSEASKRPSGEASPSHGSHENQAHEDHRLVAEKPEPDFGRVLLEDNEDVVDVGVWEPYKSSTDGVRAAKLSTGDAHRRWRVLHASTDWIEHHDAHGLEKFEPTRNIEVLEVTIAVPESISSDDADDQAADFLQSSVTPAVLDLRDTILESYHELASILNPSLPPYTSPLVHSLVSATSSPLFSALVLVHPSSPVVDVTGGRIHMGRRRSSRAAHNFNMVAAERAIIQALSPYIPIVSSSSLSTLPFAASVHHIHPHTVLQAGTLSVLRTDAADQFLRWYEIERIVKSPSEKTVLARSSPGEFAPSDTVQLGSPKQKGKVRALFEDGHAADTVRHPKSAKRRVHDEAFASRKLVWESELSEHVARRRKSDAQTLSPQLKARSSSSLSSPVSGGSLAGSCLTHNPADAWAASYAGPPLDPLHFPSVLWLSLSLLGPLRQRARHEIVNRVSGFTAPLFTLGRKKQLPGGTTGDESEIKDQLRASDVSKHKPQQLATTSSARRAWRSGYLSALGNASWTVGVVGIVGIGVGFLVGVGYSFVR